MNSQFFVLIFLISLTLSGCSCRLVYKGLIALDLIGSGFFPVFTIRSRCKGQKGIVISRLLKIGINKIALSYFFKVINISLPALTNILF